MTDYRQLQELHSVTREVEKLSLQQNWSIRSISKCDASYIQKFCEGWLERKTVELLDFLKAVG